MVVSDSKNSYRCYRCGKSYENRQGVVTDALKFFMAEPRRARQGAVKKRALPSEHPSPSAHALLLEPYRSPLPPVFLCDPPLRRGSRGSASGIIADYAFSL